jgi:predicted NBD/HSP70 family sugar kinase
MSDLDTAAVEALAARIVLDAHPSERPCVVCPCCEAAATLRGLLAEREDLTEEVERRRTQVAHLQSTAEAAAIEIEEHWDAHCDEEGAGPVNLVRRLKEKAVCYPGACETARVLQQGYDDVKAERDAARAKLREAAERVDRILAGLDAEKETP